MNPSQNNLSNLTGDRKALVIGIGFKKSVNKTIKGAIYDAVSMVDMLIHNFDFEAKDIVLLTDESKEYLANLTDEVKAITAPYLGKVHFTLPPDGNINLPTRDRILEEMENLVRGAKANDSLFFFYAGHGSQIQDDDGDEWDAKDEFIFALDGLDKKGKPEQQYITDDEMYDILVRGLPERCRLTAVFHCCHSGTILDLPYEYDENGDEISPKPPRFNLLTCILGTPYNPKANLEKRSPTKDVVCFSACKDTQLSYYITPTSGHAYGLYTRFFQQYILQGIPIRDLVKKPGESIARINAKFVATGKETVEHHPQLSSSYPLNMDQIFRF